MRRRAENLYGPGFLRWLARHDPDLRAAIDLRLPGERIRDPGSYRLLLNWFDPAFDKGGRFLEWTRALSRRLPAVNTVAAFERCRKSAQSLILRENGFDAPPVGPVGSFAPPFLVRSDVVHAAAVHRVERADTLPDVSRMVEPVASPFVDTRSPDGYYRKYRYALFGPRGVPRHLQISRSWLVRMKSRELGPARVEEELAYLNADDPRHEDLDRARRALGLDVVAFDYSLRPDGRMVLWEANPLPAFWLSSMEGETFRYQRPTLERVWSFWRDFLRARL